VPCRLGDLSWTRYLPAYADGRKADSINSASSPASPEDRALELDIAHTFHREGALVTTAQSLRHALVLVEHDGLAAVIWLAPSGMVTVSNFCERLLARDLIYSGLAQQDGACQRGLYLAKPATSSTPVETMVVCCKIRGVCLWPNSETCPSAASDGQADLVQ
jgi:hypothetical protein